MANLKSVALFLKIVEEVIRNCFKLSVKLRSENKRAV